MTGSSSASSGGRSWKDAIARSRAALLLVSPAFLASDFIMEQELPTLIERGVRLVPGAGAAVLVAGGAGVGGRAVGPRPQT